MTSSPHAQTLAFASHLIQLVCNSLWRNLGAIAFNLVILLARELVE